MSLILENAVAVTPESVEKRDLYVLNGHFVAERPAHAKSVDLAGHLVFLAVLAVRPTGFFPRVTG